MALLRYNRYPGRFASATTSYPQGAFKNKSGPTAKDGSYAEADWLNDWDGFFGRLLTVAGVSPNGSVDSAQSSQYYDALMSIVTGRLNQKVITVTKAGTYSYTPSSQSVKFIEVTVTGAGASGSGCQASSVNDSFSGGGGGAGGTARKIIAVSYGTAYPYTVGQGGKSVTGAVAGVSGTGSSFNSQVICAGGFPAGTGGKTYMPGGGGGSASGGDLNIPGGDGQDGQNGQLFSTGNGGSSFYGGGGRAGAAGGVSARAPGAGGGGAYDSTYSGTAYASGAGQDGCVIIREYY